eukprot:403376920
MLMCGDTLCQTCFYASRMPQDNNKFRCPFDGEELDVPQNLIVNKALIKAVEKNMESQRFIIMCSKHQSRECDYTCSQHDNEMLCVDCLLEHADHRDKLKKIDWTAIVKECEQLLSQLQDSTSSIVKMVSWLSAFKDKDKICDFLEYKHQISQANQLLDILSGKGTFENNLDPQSMNVDEECKSYEHIVKKKRNIFQEGFFDDSKIVKTMEDQQFLSIISQVNQVRTKLLFRASRDGFLPDIFHHLCDNKGPTVTLVRSHTGNTFGGYTSQSWTCPKNQHSIMDKNAFIFSITHRSMHKIAQNLGYSVTHDREYLPVFCGGFGVSLFCKYSGRCNVGISNLGAVYACPVGMRYPDAKTSSYLAGSYEFIADEIEVYQLISV